ncbi:hypothetical protein HPB47_008419 [Ixodes persulcatus]|uniref:Uncharacterized protein n=1 Tax=Ixodes persulcatus TaxID=34615 RepID=A0AC60P4Y4_IXOPE|nr:hypothetical protein HPB47_008419 [Ixodes persulcatus]
MENSLECGPRCGRGGGDHQGRWRHRGGGASKAISITSPRGLEGPNGPTEERGAVTALEPQLTSADEVKMLPASGLWHGRAEA